MYRLCMRILALVMMVLIIAGSCSSASPESLSEASSASRLPTNSSQAPSLTTREVSTTETTAASSTTTTSAPVGSGRLVKVQQQADGTWTFEGQAQVGEGTLPDSDVWLFQVDENGQRTGARAVVGSADVDESGLANFSGELPAELGRHGGPFVFEALASGAYEIVVSSYPDLRFSDRYALGVTVGVDVNVPLRPVLPLATDESGELRVDGVAGVLFGGGFESSMTELTARFGEPSMDSGWYQGCVDFEPVIRVVWWDFGEDYVGPNLKVEFHGELNDESKRGETEFEPEWVSDQRFTNYVYAVYGPSFDFDNLLATPDGLRPGTSIAQLRVAVPEVNFYYSGDDSPAIPNAWWSDGYHGRISGDPTSSKTVVQTVSAGRQLSGLPC